MKFTTRLLVVACLFAGVFGVALDAPVAYAASASADHSAVTINSTATGVDLSVRLTADHAQVPKYAYVTYTFTVTNEGTANATGVSASLPKPADYAYDAHTPSRGTYQNWNGRWQIGAVAAGESVTLTVKLYTLTDAPRTAFGQVTACQQKDVDSTPNDGNGTTARQDDEAAFTTNGTTTSAPGSGTTGGGTTGGGTTGGGTTGGGTTGGGTTGGGTTGGGTTGGGTTGGGTTGGGTTGGTNTGGTSSKGVDLALTISADVPTVKRYGFVTYTLTVKNEGTAPASGVVVSFPKPDDYKFTRKVPSDADYSDWNGRWVVDAIAPGTSRQLAVTLFTLSSEPRVAYTQVAACNQTEADSAPNNGNGKQPVEDDEAAVGTNGGVVVSSPVVDTGGGTTGGGTTGGGTTAGNTTTEQATVGDTTATTPAGQVNLSLKLVADQTKVRNYSNVSYTLTLTNSAATAATGVLVNFPKPSKYAWVSDATTAGTYYNHTGEWKVGGVASNSSVVLKVTLFTLTTDERAAFAEVAACTQKDANSTPANGNGKTPLEDDEAVFVTNAVAGGGGVVTGPKVPADTTVVVVTPPSGPSTTTSSAACTPDANGRVHISCFESLAPGSQQPTLLLPDATHTFQRLSRAGDPYTEGGGVAGRNHDFAGFVARDSPGKRSGYLSINHESSPGGVSMLEVSYDSTARLWSVDRSRAVDFGTYELGGTQRNCSGAVTPWGTILTAEETTSGGDATGDGYNDHGWLVEIDPATARVAAGPNGLKQKLWALGRLTHENAVVHSDERTVYFGEDGGSSAIFKFVADQPRDLTSGELFVLKLDSTLIDGVPVVSTGRWLSVPTATITERNRVNDVAKALGATSFNGVEDVEINPLTGQIYFTSKGLGRVYRFTDDVFSITSFVSYLGGRKYPIVSAGRTYQEDWSTGNDNLAFDDLGNLWVAQDGGLNYLWVVGADHTDAKPNVRIFARIVQGAEPTGLNFTPDYRFAFFSVQHPSSAAQPQPDASNTNVRIDESSTVVFGRRESLGSRRSTQTSQRLVFDAESAPTDVKVSVSPNPTPGLVRVELPQVLPSTNVRISLYDVSGRRMVELHNEVTVGRGYETTLDIRQAAKTGGMYILHIEAGSDVFSERISLRPGNWSSAN